MTMDMAKRKEVLDRRTGIADAEMRAIAEKYNLLAYADGTINMKAVAKYPSIAKFVKETGIVNVYDERVAQ